MSVHVGHIRAAPPPNDFKKETTLDQSFFVNRRKLELEVTTSFVRENLTVQENLTGIQWKLRLKTSFNQTTVSVLLSGVERPTVTQKNNHPTATPYNQSSSRASATIVTNY